MNLPDEIQVCPEHGEFVMKKSELMGKVFTTKCPSCSNAEKSKIAERERLAQTQQRDRLIKKLLGESGIPKRFAGRTFQNFKATSIGQSKNLGIAKSFAERFDSILATGASLVMCGKPGTGKTHLASAIANHICNQGRSVLFLNVMKATRLVKDTWRRDSKESEQDVYKTMLAPDLLILDEVGVQFGSEAEKLILFEILNGRYENMRPTIVISNLNQAEITLFLGERVMDRLQEGGGCTLISDWDSYRSHVASDSDLPKANVTPVDWQKNEGYRVVS